MKPALIALNRFGLGARPGEAARIGDPRAWVLGQLEGPPPSFEDSTVPTAAELADAMRARRTAGGDQAARREATVRLREIAQLESRAGLRARVRSERPFVERLVAFWSNHLCVSSLGKAMVAPLTGQYEREVIRPHVLGRFQDMVLASARHPAMLRYLDNAISIGPGSRIGRTRVNRQARGLNENYARELLELHTVGVDGGYTQNDVTELARVLTGWTVGGVEPARMADTGSATGDTVIEFMFRPALHEPGARTVMGQTYRQEGVEQGEAAIRALCEHPSTARFVATKLVRHFVADDPPEAAVAKIAQVFSATHGDLRAVAAAVAALPDAWDGSHRKFRAPQDWLVAVLRGLDVREVPNNAPNVLGQLRHAIWAPPSPKGWADTMAEWADSDSMMNRAELAHTLAERVGARANPAGLSELVELAADDPLLAMVTDESIEPGQRVALTIASPAFQWR